MKLSFFTKLKSLLNDEIDTCFQVSMQVISNNVNDLSTGTVRAYEKGELFASRDFDEHIQRDCM